MANNDLKSFQDVIEDLSEKYNIPFEVVEQILIDYICNQYFSLTGREVHEEDL